MTTRTYRRINHLPAKILVVTMSHEKRLCRERIGLHVDITTSNLVHETTFPHVRQAAHEQGARVGVQSGQTGQVLAHFFQVGQGSFLALEHGTHATESGALETLASVQRVPVLDHANHVAGNRVHQRSCRVNLTQSQLVVIAIVQRVAKIRVKRMNVVQSRKVSQNLAYCYNESRHMTDRISRRDVRTGEPQIVAEPKIRQNWKTYNARRLSAA